MGKKNPIKQAFFIKGGSSFWTVKSKHFTEAPMRFSQAAGDANPNGWCPKSYVEIKTTFMKLRSGGNILPILLI